MYLYNVKLFRLWVFIELTIVTVTQRCFNTVNGTSPVLALACRQTITSEL